MTASFTDSRWKRLALAFGFWTLLGLSYAVSNGMSRLSEGEPPSWDRMLTWYIGGFWLWMLLVPAIAWLGRFTASRSWRFFCLVHVPAGLLIALIHVLVQASSFWELYGTQMPKIHTLGQYLQVEFVNGLHLSIIVYWVILAVLRGMESRRRLRDERLRSAQLETQLAQSQLQTLRVQLQPHFLFNTLNAISALALADPMQARMMISRLSDMLRLTLEERHTQLLPLSRELEFVRNYLDIQRVRFRDRLAVHFEVSDEVLHAEVPSMILQPLVENALKHGLLEKTTHGNLYLSARREGYGLRLTVEDDGLGLPSESVADGIGLGNTRARLEMLFGTAASMKLLARAGGGTCAEIRMPFRPAVVERAA